MDAIYDYDGFIPLEKVKNTRVLLLGCGAVGCNVILALLQTGYRKITLVDYDTISLHNCARSAGLFHPECDVGRRKTDVLGQYALGWDKECEIKTVNADVRDYGHGFFIGYDVVICALDNYEAVDWVGECMAESGIPLYRTATNGWNYSVEIVRNIKDGACLCCNHERKSDIRVDSCGVRYLSDVKAGRTPALQVSSAIAANRLVLAATRDLCETRTEDIRYYDTGDKLYKFHLSRILSCACHEIEDDFAADICLEFDTATLRQLMSLTNSDLVYAHDDLILRDGCEKCGTSPIVGPVRKFYERDTKCPRCGEPCKCRMKMCFTEEDGELLDKTLAELGFRRFAPIVCRVEGNLRQYNIAEK